MVKNPPANAGNTRDTGSILGFGRHPGGGNGNSLQYSPKNPVDRGAWWSITHKVTSSRIRLKQLSTHTANFMVQLSHPYMTPGKTTALTIWIFVGKVMSLLFKMLSRFVIAFLPRSKCLFISWLQSPSATILEPRKIKSVTISAFSPSICHEVICVYMYFFFFFIKE